MNSKRLFAPHWNIWLPIVVNRKRKEYQHRAPPCNNSIRKSDVQRVSQLRFTTRIAILVRFVWLVPSPWIFGLHRDFLEYGSRWSKCFYPITLGYCLIGWFVDLYALTCAKVNWLKKQGSITLDYPYAFLYER